MRAHPLAIATLASLALMPVAVPPAFAQAGGTVPRVSNGRLVPQPVALFRFVIMQIFWA